MVRSGGLSPRSSRLTALGFAVLSIALVGSLWAVPYLPTNDGPESVFAVHMENHFGDDGVIYPEVFTPAPQFAGRGFTVLFEPLEESLGWERGLQVALSIIVLIYAWGFVALVHAIDPRRAPVAFLGFPLALSWSLYMGFFAFVLSSGVGLLILAFAIGDRGAGTARRALVASLLLLQAFLHMFGAIVTGVVLATIRVARAPRGARFAEISKVALTGLPAAGLVVAAVVVARRGAAEAAFSRSFAFVPLREALAMWPRTAAPGSLASALAVTVLVVGCVLLGGARVGRAGTSVTDRAVAVLAIAFLLASVFAPRDVPGWQCFAERFVGIGLVLAIVGLPFEQAPRGAAMIAFAGSLLWVLLAYPLHRRLAAVSADAIAGLAAPVRFHRVWLPVKLDPPRAAETAEVPLMEPLWHIGGLYETVLGGLTPYTFASNPASWPFAIRKDALHPPPVPKIEQSVTLLELPEFQTDFAFREEQENVLATFGMFYEGIVVTGARPFDLAVWERRGFVADWQRGSVLVAHFEPCPVDVILPRGLPLPLLDVGVGSTEVLRNTTAPPLPVGDDRIRLAAPHGPCGRIWVRPHWDETPPDGAKQVSFCENADARGAIEVTVTRAGGHADCSGIGSPTRGP